MHDIRGPVDVVVVGAGLTGLIHALAACLQGLSVAVIEQDARSWATNVCGSGQVYSTADQAPQARELAVSTREWWLAMARTADVEMGTSGSLLLARTDAEIAVLEEFVSLRDDSTARLVSAAAARELSDFAIPDLRAAAHLPLDLVVDPLAFVPALAAWLEDRRVQFVWGAHVCHVQDAAGCGNATVVTNRGSASASSVIFCVGHDVERLFPDLAREQSLETCQVSTVEARPVVSSVVATPGRAGRRLPTLMPGLSMLAHPGLAGTDAANQVFEESTRAAAEQLILRMNPTIVPTAGDRFIVGTTQNVDPFDRAADEVAGVEALIHEAEGLLGCQLRGVRRWSRPQTGSSTGSAVTGSPMPFVHVSNTGSDVGIAETLTQARRTLDEVWLELQGVSTTRAWG